MIEVGDIKKSFLTAKNKVRALSGVDFTAPKGKIFTLLGPSGCGKSTTLRCIAGLEKPEEGEISIGGRLVYSSSQKIFLPPEKRRIGMVFQSYAIWPHMTVFQNVAYPLKIRRVAKSVIREKVAKVLSLVGLEELADRQAPQLSGGQQQRVALARALVGEPEVLLLDEPLSNLDAKLREQMRWEIMLLQRKLGITVIYVTHDQEEALTISDQIAVMHEGRLLEVGQPKEIYELPRHPFTANFLGSANIVPGLVVEEEGKKCLVQTDIGNFWAIKASSEKEYAQKQVQLMFRPENVATVLQADDMEMNIFRAEVSEFVFAGSVMEYTVKAQGQIFRVMLHPSKPLRVGEITTFKVEPQFCVLLADHDKGGSGNGNEGSLTAVD